MRRNLLQIMFVGLLIISARFALGQSSSSKLWTLPQARVRVHALDEFRNSLPGASVRLVFCEPTNNTAIVYEEGLTGQDGIFSAQGYTDHVPGSSCQKSGYYLGWFAISPFTNAVENRWQPWDAIYTSVLRKIENPTPMYAKQAFVKVPALGKSCGYDLMVGDWVSPWGKGFVSDFVFMMSNDYTNFNHYNASMKISFSNPLDGIQAADLPKEYAQSEFIWPRQSPETGYVGAYQQEFGLPNKGFQIPNAPQIRFGEDIKAQKFYFRVRTVEKDGKIVSALYGKLSQGFEMGAENPNAVKVRICYYLNPKPLDRNMEFDIKRNLFSKIDRLETPRRP